VIPIAKPVANMSGNMNMLLTKDAADNSAVVWWPTMILSTKPVRITPNWPTMMGTPIANSER